MAAEADDAEMLAEIDRDAEALRVTFERERTALLFSGEYDQRARPGDASARVPAGPRRPTGPRCSCACSSGGPSGTGFSTEVLDQTEGEQTGLKSVTFDVDGRRAYGWLRAERGVHRLVRISPYDSQKRRQTTFALIEVMPEVEDEAEVELNWDEIRVEMLPLVRAPADSTSRRRTPPCA